MGTFDPSHHSEHEPVGARRTWVWAAGGLAGLALAALLFWPTTPEPESTTASVPAPAAEAPPARTETPAPAAEPAEPAAPRPAPRPRPRTKTEPAPAPEPEPEEKAPVDGTVRIESDVPGAAIFIDRKFVGNAPVTAEGITPGSHQLNASATGHEGIARTIDVVAGSNEVSVRFNEIRLDEAIDVVHKKMFGSTSGRLVATPAGLRFETANPKDGFVAKLTDLQEFEVDYLKKNLKVKLKDGKTFNFTDKQDNADRLFVFHRNVDKVRAKVLGSSEP